MLRKLHSLLMLMIALFVYNTGFAQKANGTLQGVVKDADLGEPLPFVTITIHSKSSGELVGGQITDDKGKFTIKNLPLDSLEVNFQFIGYESYAQVLSLTENNRSINVGTISIAEEVSLLEGVEVVAERSTIEQKIDRKVINIGKDLSSTGPTAADLMVNIPSVDVDQNGNVSLRGNENVRILINGKPTNLDASQLLQQIPSTSIQKIELITSPSAKYNPEGMSGIINVVLRKNTNLGLNGNISTGLTRGLETRFTGSADVNYRSDKINVHGNYGHNQGRYLTNGNIDRFSDASSEVWSSTRDPNSHLFKVGLDYFLSDNTTISGYTIQNHSDQERGSSTEILYPEGSLLGFGQEYGSASESHTATYNFDIKHKWGENGQNLELEVDLNDYDSEEDAAFLLTSEANPDVNALETVLLDRQNTTVNLDYVNPIDGNIKLELGAEARIQKTQNDYETSNPNFVDANYDLDRDIYSVYATFSQDLGQWSYQIGSRLESFKGTGELLEPGEELQVFEDDIFSVYPSGYVRFVPDPDSQKDAFNLNASRRVDRPNLTQLNPIRVWSSARINNVGNPSLAPQFTNSIEFNYVRQLKKGSVTSGVFFRKIYDEITRFGFNDPATEGNILFSYNNYDDNSAYGFELSSNYSFTSWWSMNSSFDVYSQTQRGVAVDALNEVQNVLLNFRMNHSFKASKNLTLQLFGMYRGANTNLQYKTLAFYFINIGGRYRVLKGKGTVSLNFTDIFRDQQFSFEGDRPVPQAGVFQWDSRTVFFGFSYRFGSGGKRLLSRKKRDKMETKSAGF